MDPHPGRYRILHELGRAFAERLEIDELLPVVIARTRETFQADGVSVILLDRARDELYFPWVAADDPEVVARLARLRIPADRGIAGAVLQSGVAQAVTEVQREPAFYGAVDHATGLTTRSLLCAPLRTRQGSIGVLQVVNPREESPEGALELVDAVAASIAVALENAQLYAELRASEQRLRTEVGVLRRDLARHAGTFTELVGTSPAMANVFRLMESAAVAPVTVLIEGETGTGKELVARALHQAGPRAEESFIAINCAALPEALLESELFGHRKGAFTGALHDRRGLFEVADRGTLLLDEVGEMPPAMQAKLLRVLQEGEVTPIGDHRPRPVDVRVIAATNRDLAAEVRKRAFREDLYYRLSTFPILLPPLRERRDDIPLLVERFLGTTAARHGKEVPGIQPAALDALARFSWPGNVRELQNEVARSVALVPTGARIGLEHLSAKITTAAPAPAEPSGDGTLRPLRAAREAFEIEYITRTLRSQGNNVTRTARILGLSRVMLQKKMRDYGLREPER